MLDALSTSLIEKPDLVRLADYRDEDELYAFVFAMRSIGPIARLWPPEPGKILAQIEVGTRPDPVVRTVHGDTRIGIIGVISDAPGARVKASVGLCLQEPWYSAVPMLTSLWLFVRPEEQRHRGLAHALFRFALWARADMQERMRAYAEERREPVIQLCLDLSYIADGRLAAYDRLWGRYGRRIGSIFLVN